MLDAEAFSQVKCWIADCDANHQCCSQAAPLPDTLLDVGSFDSEGSVMIVHLGDDVRGSYTALSYPHERGIKSCEVGQATGQCESSLVNMTTLPRLFQDAIRLTHDLGIKYLWIDAICISEDRGRNFERDSAAFGSIFANATLTLAATGSRSNSEGLFFHRTARSSIRIPQSVSEGTTGDLWMQVLPLDKEVLRSPYIEMKSEPLWSGVWAFQERVLSPRILHFASDQIYFECMEHFVSEDGLLLDNRYHTVHNIDRDTGLLRWFELIWTYGQCDVADASDKLPALSNIAKSYQVIFEDKYIAGNWNTSLVECLCWQSVECKPVDLRRAPSWSWASVDGIVGMGFHTPTWESFATIHNAHVQLDGPNPFGKIREAWIDLEAPLVPLTLAETQGATGDIFLQTKEGSEVGFHAGFDTIPRAYAASAELVQSMELFAVVLAETRMLDCSPEECGSSPCYHGIIVTPIDGRTEQMKRVGFFIAGPEDLPLDSVSSHNKSITLV